MIKYPCITCSKPVRNNQNGILCTFCDKWAHLSCSSVSRDFFLSQNDWICTICSFKELPNGLDISETENCNIQDNQTTSSFVNQHDNQQELPSFECESHFIPMNDTITCTNDNTTNNFHIDGEISNSVKMDIDRLQLLKGLKVGHLNCLSLRKHIDEMRSLVKRCGMDIMTLSETHLQPDIEDNDVHIPGYTILRKDRNRYGGGVAVFIRNGIEFLGRNDLIEDENIEMLIIEIRLQKQKPFLVLCWYRPPNSSITLFDDFEKIIQNVDNSNMPYCVLGDLNCDVQNSPIPNHSKRLLGIMESYDCRQLIEKPTRVAQTSSTTVDLIFSNCSEKITESGVIEVSMTDHYMIYCVLGKSKSGHSHFHKYRTGRCLKNFNEELFIADISKVDFSSVLNSDDPQIACSTFLSILTPVMDKHAPLRRSRVKLKCSPWMTTDILELIHKRDILKKKAKISLKDDDWVKYKKARNNVTAQIRQAKRTFVSRNVESAGKNVKKIWSSLRNLFPAKKNISDSITCIKVQDRLLKGQELTNAFNDYFSTIGKTLHDTFAANQSEPNIHASPTPQEHMFKFRDVLPSEVENILRSLSIDKATGPDNIPAKLLKPITAVITPLLTHILNCSLRNGVVPSQWKCARVTPIYKSGDRTSLENYRPISVIPIFAKIMEKVVYIQVHDYLTENEILSDCQSGFRPLHSTESALLNVTEKCLDAMDKGDFVCLAMIDLKKAFDTVDHSLLLNKLRMYGFNHLPLKWFQNYFDERYQYTSVNGYTSDRNLMVCGVPQGSLLGPLLYTIFVNDMPNYVNYCNIALYADDTCLYTSTKDPHTAVRNINKDLENLSDWLHKNKLMINSKKCEAMFVGSAQRLKKKQNTIENLNIYINDTKIRQVDSCKYLGVIIDKNLQWKLHIEHVQKKVVKHMYLLRRLRPYVNQNTALLFYKSIVQSQFDYCSSVWANAYKTHLEKLQVLQNRTLRIVLNVDHLFSSKSLYQMLKLDRLNERWSKQLACKMYRSINKLCPTYLSNLFTFQQSRYNTRSGSFKLKLSQPKTNFGKRTFLYRGSKLWNSLRPPAHSTVSVQAFKRYLQQYPIITQSPGSLSH